MSYALKRGGRFVVMWESVVNSGRRTRGLAGFRMLLALFYMAFYPRMLTRRARGADKYVCNWSVVRALNVFILLLIIALLPIWMLVPSSLTPPGSFAGEIRYGVSILGCHISLVLWPCAYFLCRSLIQQRPSIDELNWRP